MEYEESEWSMGERTEYEESGRVGGGRKGGRRASGWENGRRVGGGREGGRRLKEWEKVE